MLQRRKQAGVVALAALVSMFSMSAIAHEKERDHRYKTEYKKNYSYKDIIRIKNNKKIRGNLAPQVRFTSPTNAGIVARGEGFVGAGSANGTGFVINLELVTRDRTSIDVNEATQVPGDPGIRNVDQLGKLNPEIPGLFVFINSDLITPTGDIIRKNTNLAPLFNVAGTDDTPGRGITTWVGWHVLESFPVGSDKFEIVAAMVDKKGRIGFDRIKVNIDQNLQSANALTPDPSSFAYPNSTNYENGPLVEIVAPRTPSAIAIGTQTELPNGETGSLHFIQVNALDINSAGIAVDEVGQTVTKPDFGLGSILDPLQLGKGDNRNFPGLDFTFDVPLLAPTGLLVEAGQNLAPVFNIVGSEVEPTTGRVLVVADWVVGSSLLLPEGKEHITMTAKVTDNQGRVGVAKRSFMISETENGQRLTPMPRGFKDD